VVLHPRGTTVLLCGDVMLGRGIDQILPHPSAATLREPYVADAREYVQLAEAVSGPIPRGVDPTYVWGDALVEADRISPDARILNLETSITRSDDYWPGKGIHYRMHPDNVACLQAARPDVCVLANNHVLDFGEAGLVETLETLERAGIRTAGAGRTLAGARAPAAVEVAGDRRVVVFACGTTDSGILHGMAATETRPGLIMLTDLSAATARRVCDRVAAVKRPGDLLVLSIHWGDNWGYDVSDREIAFAHAVVDGGVDVVFGHSSHHPRPIEVYRDRLILYGCGDCLDDYEGISGHEAFRDDLTLWYAATCDPASGRVLALTMSPMQIRRFRLSRAMAADVRWMQATLNRISGRFNTRIESTDKGRLALVVEARENPTRPEGAR
jgi:poly-gamma-glutamate capsule biosynthesis protein CapA/YwtB (metallophosphatase superfamily)